MKIHKLTAQLMILLIMVSLLISYKLVDKTSECMNWLENIFIGIFASSLLILITSCVNYIIEENRSIYSFYWNLSELKSRVLILSTIPVEEKSVQAYYNAIYNVNELFRTEFALFDQNFIFIRRKKIQKVLEIYIALHEYKSSSTVAEQKMREYLANTKNHDGTRTYSSEQFQNDIANFCDKTNNFKNSNKPFVIYIEEKMNELSKYITYYK